MCANAIVMVSMFFFQSLHSADVFYYNIYNRLLMHVKFRVTNKVLGPGLPLVRVAHNDEDPGSDPDYWILNKG